MHWTIGKQHGLLNYSNNLAPMPYSPLNRGTVLWKMVFRVQASITIRKMRLSSTRRFRSMAVWHLTTSATIYRGSKSLRSYHFWCVLTTRCTQTSIFIFFKYPVLFYFFQFIIPSHYQWKDKQQEEETKDAENGPIKVNFRN